jgi:hypothetical protein
MNSNENKFKFSGTGLLLALVLASLSKFFSFNFMVGSLHTFFSLVNVAGPLTYALGGYLGGLVFLVLNLAFSMKSAFLLTHTGLPNFLAGWYWYSDSKFLKLLVPIACMGLFWAKTFGTLAAPYALLWLIPIALTSFNVHNVFGKALGATFIAHCVGSVIWVYCVPMAVMSWFTLIPVALVERVSLALMMVLTYKFLQAASIKINCLLKIKCGPEKGLIL